MNSAPLSTPTVTPRAKSSARLHAVQAVYQMILSEASAREILDDFIVSRIGFEPEFLELERPAIDLLSAIVQGVSRARGDLEPVITAHLKDGKTAADMAEKEPLLLSILLCGAYELMAHPEVDPPVIISDYINVTHSYYTGQESRMINGILDAIRPLYRNH